MPSIMTFSPVVAGRELRPPGESTLFGPGQRHGKRRLGVFNATKGRGKFPALIVPLTGRGGRKRDDERPPGRPGASPAGRRERAACYADRRLRPLARLRLIRARPVEVLMRARKPWVRLRLILLGW